MPTFKILKTFSRKLKDGDEMVNRQPNTVLPHNTVDMSAAEAEPYVKAGFIKAAKAKKK